MFNKERKHWIATHYQNGKVKVYDSCFSGSLSPSIREMLVCLYIDLLSGTTASLSQSCQLYNREGVLTVVFFAIGTAASGLSCDLKQEERRQHLKEKHWDTDTVPNHDFLEA